MAPPIYLIGHHPPLDHIDQLFPTLPAAEDYLLHTVMPPLFRLRHALTTRRGCSTTAECCLLMGTEGYRTGCSGYAPWYLDLELSSTGGRAMPSMARLHHTSRPLSTLSLQSIVILSMNMM